MAGPGGSSIPSFGSGGPFRLSSSTFGNIGGAVSDIFGAMAAGERKKGYRAEAEGFETAARLSGENADLAKISTEIQQTQAERKALKVIGGQIADVAGAGFGAGGTAIDLLADSNRQASLEQAILGVQGDIQENAYEQQERSFLTQAEAARSAAKASGIAEIGGYIGAGFKFAGGITSLMG